MRISRDKGVAWKNKGKDKMKNSELSLAELLKKYGLDDESADTVSTDENTPPATAETPVAPPSRARVEDIKLINASARIHETTTDNSDKFKQWRKTKFGGDFDPVAEAVLHGKTWRDLGYTSRQGLNQRLDRIIARITQIQKSLKNGDFGKL